MKSRFIQLKEDLVTLSKLSNDVFNILDNQTLQFLLTTFPDTNEDETCVEDIYSMVIFEDILDFSALMIKGLLRVRKDLKRQKQSVKFGRTEGIKLKRPPYKHTFDNSQDDMDTNLPFEHIPFEGDEEIICVQPKECPVTDEVSANPPTDRNITEEDITLAKSTSSSSTDVFTMLKQGIDDGKMEEMETSTVLGSEIGNDPKVTNVNTPRQGIDMCNKSYLNHNQGLKDWVKRSPTHRELMANNGSSRQLHDIQTHVDDPEEFCCGDCGKVFSHHGSLIRHTYSSHSTQISSFYKCKTCRKLFNTYEHYKEHECWSSGKRRSVSTVMTKLMDPPRNHSSEYNIGERMSSKAPEGPEVSTKPPSYGNQMIEVSRSDTGPEGCPIDSFSDEKTRMQQPPIETTGTKPFGCNKCEYLFPTINDLKMHACTAQTDHNHVASKKEQPNYPEFKDLRPTLAAMTDSGASDSSLQASSRARGRLCKLCGGYFATYSALIDHRHIHIREYPFQCSSCEKAYKTAGELKRHQHVHTGERPYGCEFCGRYFALSHHLKRHVQTHLES